MLLCPVESLCLLCPQNAALIGDERRGRAVARLHLVYRFWGSPGASGPGTPALVDRLGVGEELLLVVAQRLYPAFDDEGPDKICDGDTTWVDEPSHEV